MIPNSIVDFLENGATVAFAGTRDANLIPQFHKVSGWSINPGNHEMCCFVPKDYSSNMISSLKDNGQIAVTLTQSENHSTYQFKGDYISHEPCTDQDIDEYVRLRERMVNTLTNLFGMDEDPSRAHSQIPIVTVRFKVNDIFLQTPGPNAGQKVNFEGEAK